RRERGEQTRGADREQEQRPPSAAALHELAQITASHVHTSSCSFILRSARRFGLVEFRQASACLAPPTLLHPRGLTVTGVHGLFKRGLELLTASLHMYDHHKCDG